MPLTQAIKIIVIFITLIRLSELSYGQELKINGVLKSTLGNPIAEEVVVLKDSSRLTIQFAISDARGKYQLTVPEGFKNGKLYLEINSLGYLFIRKPLIDGQNIYDFILEQTSVVLKDVQVKTGPVIQSKGDTLSYNVRSFSRKEDKTIGDVIKHLPGLSVSENGQISFNGKPIANFYIQGDDLMDGRYGLATKTIDKNMIKSVDVIKHFQAIRVLKNKISTDDVVINLVLKDENKWQVAGQGMVGTGLPHQYDFSANAILLNKKLKFLNSLKANNSGIDYTNDFYQYNYVNYLMRLDNANNDPLLSDAIGDIPDIPKNNYYLNHSVAINTNNLYNTKDSLQIKSNIQLFFDRNSSVFYSQTETYVPGDTIRYLDMQNSIRKPIILNTSFTAMANKPTYFIRNVLRANFGWVNNQSGITFNRQSFTQFLSGRQYDLSNDFEWIPSTKKGNVVDLHWYLNYNNQPQNLFIGTGINSNSLNQGLAYASVLQQAAIPSISSNLSVNYIITRKHFIRQSYQAFVLNEKQQLQSSILLTKLNGVVKPYEGDAGNSLDWQRNKVHLNGTYSIKKKNWELSVSIPMGLQSISFRQDTYSLNKKQVRIYTNPSLNFKLFINAEDYLVAKYTNNWRTGSISNLYKGIILSNYRTLSSNNTDLLEDRSVEYNLNYAFQRNIIMLFSNIGLTYKESFQNAVRSSIFTNDIQTNILLPLANEQNSFSLNADISKFFFLINTTSTVKFFWKTGRNQIFINNQLLPIISDAKTMSLSLSGKYFGAVSVDYSLNGLWFRNRQSGQTQTITYIQNKVTRFDQFLSVGLSLKNNLFFTIKARQIINPSNRDAITNNFLLVDANARYQLKKTRTDIEFDLSNLLDKTDYRILSLASNQYSLSNYSIRGRMAIVKLTYNF